MQEELDWRFGGKANIGHRVLILSEDTEGTILKCKKIEDGFSYLVKFDKDSKKHWFIFGENDIFFPNKFEVETILDIRERKGVMEYCVKWVGFPYKESTWEPEDNLEQETLKYAYSIFDKDFVKKQSGTKKSSKKKRKGNRNETVTKLALKKGNKMTPKKRGNESIYERTPKNIQSGRDESSLCDDEEIPKKQKLDLSEEEEKEDIEDFAVDQKGNSDDDFGTIMGTKESPKEDDRDKCSDEIDTTEEPMENINERMEEIPKEAETHEESDDDEIIYEEEEKFLDKNKSRFQKEPTETKRESVKTEEKTSDVDTTALERISLGRNSSPTLESNLLIPGSLVTSPQDQQTTAIDSLLEFPDSLIKTLFSSEDIAQNVTPYEPAAQHFPPYETQAQNLPLSNPNAAAFHCYPGIQPMYTNSNIGTQSLKTWKTEHVAEWMGSLDLSLEQAEITEIVHKEGISGYVLSQPNLTRDWWKKIGFKKLGDQCILENRCRLLQEEIQGTKGW